MGNLRPMAKWLRTQGSFTALLLAEAIERGEVVDTRPSKRKKESLRWEVGQWISEHMAAGVSYESAITEAADRFPVSKRTAERCKVEWDDWGADAIAALKFLSGSLAR